MYTGIGSRTGQVDRDMKISVITTCFNASATIGDCLESVRAQTHPDVEHIVIDGASTDDTPAILKEYGDSLAVVVSEPDSGIYDGMNKGLRLAGGDIVGILNADDMYNGPAVLAKVARLFRDERVDSCYGDLLYIRERKGLAASRCPRDFRVVRYWSAGEFDRRKFFRGWMVPHPTFFVRRSAYQKYGYFNPSLGTSADYELMLRFLVRYKISAAYLPEILIRMRVGGASNVSLPARIQANRMDRKAWEVNGLRPYPWTLWLKPLRKIGQWFSRPRS